MHVVIYVASQRQNAACSNLENDLPDVAQAPNFLLLAAHRPKPLRYTQGCRMEIGKGRNQIRTTSIRSYMNGVIKPSHPPNNSGALFIPGHFDPRKHFALLLSTRTV
jgi:hypothetical protein